MSGKKYYKKLDLLRLVLCIAVLLYHLGILKGGFLAVSAFFTLSGYLAVTTSFAKEKFSFKDYYLNKLKRLYLPFLIVTLISVAAIYFIKDITWLNLKVETTSSILGYNNFWQLGANLDYFTRHTSSPFMHYWYIAILLQFDLLFPFIFSILKKIGEKTKIIPVIVTLLITLSSGYYFALNCLNGNLMIAYYSTFARVFSIFLGMFLAYIDIYYEYQKIGNIKSINILSTLLYYALFIILFVYGSYDSRYFALLMICSSLVTLRLISYATVKEENINIFDKVIKFVASLTYEIYLVQYPIIYIFSELGYPLVTKIVGTIILTLIISYIINAAFKTKKLTTKCILFTMLGLIALFGFCVYLVSEDHSEEMSKLEEELALNEKILKENQEKYASNFNEEMANWEETLKSFEEGSANIKDIVSNLQIVGIGDSVMLGAVPNLYEVFPKGYFDAGISRSAWVITGIIDDLTSKNMMGDTLLINLGANGLCPENCQNKIIEKTKDKNVFWVNVTNNKSVHVNEILESFDNTHDNIHIIDWNTISSGHPEYFIADGIHLTPEGREAYSHAIYDAIYNFYLGKLNAEKEKMINEHNEELNKRISFIGNDLLLNAYESLSKDYSSSSFTIDNNYTYEKLKVAISDLISNNTLNHKVVLLLDSNIILSSDEMTDLKKLCNNHELYIVSTAKNNDISFLNYYNIYSDMNGLFMADNVHLSKDGNKKLITILKEIIK